MQPIIYATTVLFWCAAGLTSATYDDLYDVELADGKYHYDYAYAQMRDNIYEDEKFSPKRTLYNLRKWYYLMTLREPVEEYKIEEKENVARLIHASIITPSKCSRRSYNEINSLLKEFEEEKYNIIPYLKKQRKRLYEFCLELLDDMLRTDD